MSSVVGIALAPAEGPGFNGWLFMISFKSANGSERVLFIRVLV